MSEDRSWIFLYQEELNQEIDKISDEVQQNLGYKPEVKLEYEIKLTVKADIKIPNYTPVYKYTYNYNLNPKSTKGYRKPKLLAREIGRRILAKHNSANKIPHLYTRIWTTKKLNNTYPYGTTPTDPVEIAAVTAPPTPLEEKLHPGLSRKLKKELEKL